MNFWAPLSPKQNKDKYIEDLLGNKNYFLVNARLPVGLKNSPYHSWFYIVARLYCRCYDIGGLTCPNIASDLKSHGHLQSVRSRQESNMMLGLQDKSLSDICEHLYCLGGVSRCWKKQKCHRVMTTCNEGIKRSHIWTRTQVEWPQGNSWHPTR